MKYLILVFVFAAALATGGQNQAPPHLSLWVATVLCDDGHGLQMLSFVDAEQSRDRVASHLNEMIQTRFPGGKVISVRIEAVSESVIDRICAARAAERRF